MCPLNIYALSKNEPSRTSQLNWLHQIFLAAVSLWITDIVTAGCSFCGIQWGPGPSLNCGLLDSNQVVYIWSGNSSPTVWDLQVLMTISTNMGGSFCSGQTLEVASLVETGAEVTSGGWSYGACVAVPAKPNPPNLSILVITTIRRVLFLNQGELFQRYYHAWKVELTEREKHGVCVQMLYHNRNVTLPVGLSRIWTWNDH